MRDSKGMFLIYRKGCVRHSDGFNCVYYYGIVMLIFGLRVF